MNPRGNLHHAEDRMLTLMERKRIQSIPDDIHISVSRSHSLMQHASCIMLAQEGFGIWKKFGFNCMMESFTLKLQGSSIS